MPSLREYPGISSFFLLNFKFRPIFILRLSSATLECFDPSIIKTVPVILENKCLEIAEKFKDIILWLHYPWKFSTSLSLQWYDYYCYSKLEWYLRNYPSVLCTVAAPKKYTKILIRVWLGTQKPLRLCAQQNIVCFYTNAEWRTIQR